MASMVWSAMRKWWHSLIINIKNYKTITKKYKNSIMGSFTTLKRLFYIFSTFRKEKILSFMNYIHTYIYMHLRNVIKTENNNQSFKSLYVIVNGQNPLTFDWFLCTFSFDRLFFRFHVFHSPKPKGKEKESKNSKAQKKRKVAEKIQFCKNKHKKPFPWVNKGSMQQQEEKTEQ